MRKISKSRLRLDREVVKHLDELDLTVVRGGRKEPGSLKCTEKGNSLCVAVGCV
jgi:hypothetical protein